MSGARFAHGQRLLALAILAGLFLLGASVLTQPIREAFAQRSEVEARLARYDAMLREPTVQTSAYDPAELSMAAADDAEVVLALQSLLDTRARTAGLVPQTVSPAGAEPLGELGRVVWIGATLAGDLQAVTDFLVSLDAERPVVLIGALDLSAGAPLTPDQNVSLRIELGRAWRSEGGAT